MDQERVYQMATIWEAAKLDEQKRRKKEEEAEEEEKEKKEKKRKVFRFVTAWGLVGGLLYHVYDLFSA